ncbi:glutathione S-transferase family protein [Sphingosinicella soli]|uniref:Glutathione S-transferase n=1 Tax=Sphingosinicella soli TaxID=333708 RepID=A0A7W7F5D3_9SPHN|nr:glutathione S-transferase family protein [Sphingosinicella soli]MBB4631161.1 glutathione S-transferase [Sphingosinicella soli]
MKLYGMPRAPNPRRVTIFLAEKGIPIEIQEVNVAEGGNRTPEYLAVNPRGVIPALVLDDGTVIDESIAICRYFEALHPEPNLMGRDAKEIAVIESWQRRIEFDGMLAIASVYRNTQPLFANRAQPGGGPDTAQIPALAERGHLLLPGFFAMLNQRLGESPYVAGDRYTVADISAIVAIDFARWIKVRIPENHANTLRWHAEVTDRPSYAA